MDKPIREDLSCPSHNIIDYLKFALILGVVAIHSRTEIPATDASLFGADAVDFFGLTLVGCSVPCFFIISGFLYFRRIDKMTPELYISKSRNRLKTLLIPYLLWNIIALGITVTKTSLLGIPAIGLFADKGITPTTILEGFWSFHDGNPYAFAFWFIRNLMVFATLSPLAWLLGRNRYIFFFFAAICCAINDSLWGFEYFVIGCALSRILGGKIPEISARTGIICGLIWVGIAIGRIFYDVSWILVTLTTVISFCALAALLCLFRNIEKVMQSRAMTLLVSSTFFIYAIHQLFATIVARIYAEVFGETTSAGLILGFFATLITLVFVSFIGWLLLKNLLPGLTRIIGGGR